MKLNHSLAVAAVGLALCASAGVSPASGQVVFSVYAGSPDWHDHDRGWHDRSVGDWHRPGYHNYGPASSLYGSANVAPFHACPTPLIVQSPVVYQQPNVIYVTPQPVVVADPVASDQGLVSVTSLINNSRQRLNEQLRTGAITSLQYGDAAESLDQMTRQAESEAFTNGGDLTSDQVSSLVNELSHTGY